MSRPPKTRTVTWSRTVVQKPDGAADQRGLSPRLRQQIEPHAVDVLGGLGWN